ncbi:hypothetical protein Esti_003252 [Eimeria stiedai]
MLAADHRRQFKRTRPSSGTVFAVVTLILMSLLVAALCKKVSNRLTEAGLTRRRLGDSGEETKSADEELQQILEQCIYFEEKAGHLQQFFMPSVPDPLESARIQAESIEQMQALASTFQPHSSSTTLTSSQQFTTWDVAREEVSHMRSQSSGLLAGQDASNPMRPSAGTASTIVSSGANDWLDQIPSLLFSVDANDWLDQIPLLVPDSTVSEEAVGSLDTLAANTIKPSTSAGAGTDAVKTTPSDVYTRLCLHPFVRLPFVPQSAVRREFNLVSPTTPHLKGSPAKMLKVMRDLFAKSVLNERDVDSLMCTVEMLVRYATVHLQTRTWRGDPAIIARQAGVSFLILDSVVCAFQVLGPTMKARKWWNSFAEGFCTEQRFPKLARGHRPTLTHNQKLARRLLAAIAIYKTGARPDLMEVITLKRMLLCSPLSPPYFKGSPWDVWRRDDDAFTASHVSALDSPDEDTES